MKKKRAQLIGMIVLLILFVIAFFALKKLNARQEENAAGETVEKLPIISEDMDEVLELSYDYEGDNVHLIKEDGTWHLEGDRENEVKQTIVNEMLYYLAPLSAVSKLDNPMGLEEYGLASPTQTINVKTASAEYVLLVGDCNDFTGCFYLKVDGSNDVYTVTDKVANACAYKNEELIKKTEEETEQSTSE